MRLIQVEIYDFKSIRHLKLPIKSNQICFVGKNECGKSSILQAISFLNLTDRELEYSHLNKSSKSFPRKGFPTVVGLFEGSKESVESLEGLLLKYEDAAALPKLNPSLPIQVQVKRWGNGLANISITVSDLHGFAREYSQVAGTNAEFYSEFFASIYPRIEYFENEDLLLEPATLDQILGDAKEFETLRRLLYLGGCENLEDLRQDDIHFVTTVQKKIENQFNGILKKHYKQDESISVSLIWSPDRKLALVITDASGNSFSIHERSPGFRYYFSFLVNKLYSSAISGGQRCLFLLDEPGNNLHPNGAKDLLKTFAEIAKEDQLLFTTHNPFLAIRNDLDSLMFVEKDHQEGTKIKNKPYLNKYQVMRQELGILLNDSFVIGHLNLIVEGPTEKFAFHRLFQMDEFRELEWVNVYDAGGVTNIAQALNYLGPRGLNLSGITFFDSDKEAVDAKKGKPFKEASEKHWNWEVLEVNDAFSDKSERTFEDLFPAKIYIKAFNQYCNFLKDLEVFEKSYIDFDEDSEPVSPIIHSLEKHFKSFVAEDKKKEKSITKQDVIRIVFEIIEKLPEEEAKKALERVRSLLSKVLVSIKKLEKNVNHEA